MLVVWSTPVMKCFTEFPCLDCINRTFKKHLAWSSDTGVCVKGPSRAGIVMEPLKV